MGVIRRPVHFLIFVFVVVFLIIDSLESFVFAAEWSEVVVKPSGAALHRGPNGDSDGLGLLGRYPGGTRLKVYNEDRGGFYAIYFPQEWNGVHYAWISKDEIELTDSPSTKSSDEYKESRKRRSKRRFDDSASDRSSLSIRTFRLGVIYRQFSPSEFQTAFGDLPTYSVRSLGFDGEFQFQLWRALLGLVHVGQYSFSQLFVSGVDLGTSYAASGYLLTAGLGFSPLRSRTFNLSVSILGGLSLNNLAIATSTVYAYPLLAEVVGDFSVYEGFGLYGKFGYQLHNLTLANPSGGLTTSFSMTGPFAGLGLNFQF